MHRIERYTRIACGIGSIKIKPKEHQSKSFCSLFESGKALFNQIFKTMQWSMVEELSNYQNKYSRYKKIFWIGWRIHGGWNGRNQVLD